jgi:hypothetical protein
MIAQSTSYAFSCPSHLFRADCIKHPTLHSMGQCLAHGSAVAHPCTLTK